jgi:hypothetical protein
VYEVVRDFIDRERQHMAMEERFVFPAAVKALRSTDWNFEDRFNKLRRKILELEEEAEGLRSSASP